MRWTERSTGRTWNAHYAKYTLRKDLSTGTLHP
jgi:hypothetical protein